MDEIRRLRRASLRTVVEAVLPSPTFALLPRLYRGRSWPNARPIPIAAFVRPAALRRRVGEALVRADVIHVVAEGEQRSIERDYSVTLTRVVVIPNGVEASPPTGPARERDVPILVPGRMDPRKNQVAVAEALHEPRQAVVFVGAPHPRGGEYVDRLTHLAEFSPWITWIRGVPPEQINDWYQRSKVVLNLSLVELLSRVDLEAYTCGCVLVTITRGHTIEWLGSAASYVDPHQVGRPVTVVREKLAGWIRTEPDAEVVRQYDWARIGSELADVYRSVAQNRGGLAQ